MKLVTVAKVLFVALLLTQNRMCLLHNSHRVNKDICFAHIDDSILEYARQKTLTPKMLYTVTLDQLLPADNFYRWLNKVLNLHWLYVAKKNYYGQRRT